MLITGGVQFTGGGIAIGPDIIPIQVGSTQSTTTPTTNGATTVGTTNGSPFTPATNNYVIPAPSTVPPYNVVTATGVGTLLNFGTGDFTMEWFQYQTDSNSFARPFWYTDAGNTTYYWGVSIEGGTFYFWGPGNYTMANSTQLGTYKNTWVHFAVVRSSGTLHLYKNGTQIGSSVSDTTSMITSNGVLNVGGKPYGGLTTEQFGGSITSFRVCNLAVYTGAFTVPTGKLAQTQGANPYGGSNTSAITAGQCAILLNP